MPCGSTTSNSTYAIDALSPSLPEVGLWKIPFVWLAGTAQAWERRRQYKELLELDDRLLTDMGLSRTTVEEVRSSPLYLIAWRDSRDPRAADYRPNSRSTSQPSSPAAGSGRADGFGGGAEARAGVGGGRYWPPGGIGASGAGACGPGCALTCEAVWNMFDSKPPRCEVDRTATGTP